PLLTTCIIRISFFFSSRRRHTRFARDWSSDVCSSDLKSTVKVDVSTLDRVEGLLRDNGIQTTGAFFEQTGPSGTVRVRFDSTDVQLRAKDIIERALNPDPQDPTYTVALNLLSASPSWLSAIGAHPMYLGLDLR